MHTLSHRWGRVIELRSALSLAAHTTSDTPFATLCEEFTEFSVLNSVFLCLSTWGFGSRLWNLTSVGTRASLHATDIW